MCNNDVNLERNSIMMSIITNLINGTNNYCCLCLKTVKGDAVLVQDTISYPTKKTLKSIKIVDILGLLLDPETLNSLLPCNSICKECRRKAITAYQFVKMCNENSKHVLKAIATILNSLPVPDQIVSCKSLFVDLNTMDYTSVPYYDMKKTVACKESALKRFQSILNNSDQQVFEESEADICSPSKIKSEDDTSVHIYIHTIKQDKQQELKSKSTMPTSEMRVGDTDFKCKMCLKTYLSSQHLRQHFLRVHAPKTFKCLQCSKIYATKSLLKQHAYDSHTSVICTKCGKTYQNRHSLKMHELGHITKIICNNCGRAYKHKKTYNKHILSNVCKEKQKRAKLEAKFMCDHCHKKFTHKGTLRVHIQFEHGNGKVHVCQWCSKKFHAQSRLNAHIVKHTKEKKFCCELCGGKFVTEHSLLCHTRIHTGDRPYECHLCDGRFLSSSRRAEHVRRYHMPIVPLECDICRSKFKGISSLVKHKKKHMDPKSKLYCSVAGKQIREINK